MSGNSQTCNFIAYFIVASERSSSNLEWILKEYIEGRTNSRIHHFLPECIAFNQSALRHEEFEDITTDVTPPSRRPFSRGFLWLSFALVYL